VCGGARLRSANTAAVGVADRRYVEPCQAAVPTCPRFGHRTYVSAWLRTCAPLRHSYMRDYRLVMPSDCFVSNTVEENAYALRQIEQLLKADISPSIALNLDALLRDHIV